MEYSCTNTRKGTGQKIRSNKLGPVSLFHSNDRVSNAKAQGKEKDQKIRKPSKIFHQNRMFHTNQAQLYTELRKDTISPEEPLNVEES